MNKEDFLKSYFLEDPERVFELPLLTHKSTEIEDIIDRFDRAAHPGPVHRWVIELLRATKTFRRSTVPEGIFSRLRTLSKTDEELKAMFHDMNEAIEIVEQLLNQSEVNEQDKKILSSALQYCKASIRERIASLQPDDRLIALWNVSDLKKQIKET